MRHVLQFLVLVSAAGLAIGEDLPKNTAEIKSLTVEQAKALLDRHHGDSSFLSLLNLTKVSDDVAAVLATHKGILHLGIKALTPQAAGRLAAHKGDLSIPGGTLSPEAARALRPHVDELRLDGLEELSKPLWEELAGHKGPLSLPGVERLSPEVVAALSQRSGGLELGLETVSPDLARELIKVRGPLRLRVVSILDVEAQDILAQHEHYLYLEFLTSLTSGKLARKIGSQPLDPKDSADFGGPGCPYLPELTQLTPEVARGLALHPGGLELTGLKSLPTDVAVALSECPGPLRLGRVVLLDDEAAKALGRHKGKLLSIGIEKVSDTVAEALASHSGDFLRLSTNDLSDKAARALAGYGGDHLELSVISTLSDEAARSLANFKGRSLLLGLEDVSPEGQAALVKYEGFLGIDGIRKIDSKAFAEKIVEGWEHDHLGIGAPLAQLQIVTPEVEDVLSELPLTLEFLSLKSLSSQRLARTVSRGMLDKRDYWTYSDFAQLEHLSPEAAREITLAPVSKLLLNSLMSLTPAVAAELARFKGPIFFGNIEKVSDDVAEALSRHDGGIMMPKLQSLTSGKLAEVIQPVQTGQDSRPLFPEIRTLSPDAARVLARRGFFDQCPYSRRSALPKLQELSDDVVRAIAESEAKPSLESLPGLTRLTNAVLAKKLFSSYAGTWENSSQLTEISPEVAKVIGEARSEPDHYLILGLRQLDKETARELASFHGALSLGNIRTLSLDVATELARHKGKPRGNGLQPAVLYLNGLEELSPEAAQVLATYDGEVHLKGLRWDTLSTEVKAIIRDHSNVLIVSSKK